MTRFWHISPVATPTPRGLRALRIAAWPRMSSGDVGSSINLHIVRVYHSRRGFRDTTYQGLNSASCFMYSIASGTDQTWFASTMRTFPSSKPMISLAILNRLRSSSTLPPTLILKCLYPCANVSCSNDLILSSPYPSHPINPHRQLQLRKKGREKHTSTCSISRNNSVHQGLLNPPLLRRLKLLQHCYRLFGCDCVSDISEIDTPYELFRSEVCDEFPEGFLNGFGPEIP